MKRPIQAMFLASALLALGACDEQSSNGGGSAAADAAKSAYEKSIIDWRVGRP